MINQHLIYIKIPKDFLSDVPRNIIIKHDEKYAGLISHEMDVICFVKKNASDSNLDQDSWRNLFDTFFNKVHQNLLKAKYSNLVWYLTCFWGSNLGDAVPVHAAHPPILPRGAQASEAFGGCEAAEVYRPGPSHVDQIPLHVLSKGNRISFGSLQLYRPRFVGPNSVLHNTGPKGLGGS